MDPRTAFLLQQCFCVVRSPQTGVFNETKFDVNETVVNGQKLRNPPILFCHWFMFESVPEICTIMLHLYLCAAIPNTFSVNCLPTVRNLSCSTDRNETIKHETGLL